MRYRNAGIGGSDKELLEYTSSLRSDKEIVEETIAVMIAHVKQLREKKLIPARAAKCLLEALKEALSNPDGILKEGYEDVHEALENYLLEKCGKLAFYAPLGRSRNDHVAAAIRLRILRKLTIILEELVKFRDKIVFKAKKHAGTPFPGHTHFQPAQALTYGHYLLSFEEELSDYTDIMLNIIDKIAKSPLGSGALAGSGVPLDRRKLASTLGFKDIALNTLYATGSRSFIQVISSLMACLAVTLSRISEDYINWCHPSISIIVPPREHIQTSSLMPHKRNPATLEVLRARMMKVIGIDMTIKSMEAKLPLGYNLDLQEITPCLWESMNEIAEGIRVLSSFIEGAEPDKKKCMKIIKEYIGGATEVAEAISIAKNKPYREAYMYVAKTLHDTQWDTNKALTVIEEETGMKLTGLREPEGQLKAKAVEGSPNPRFVQYMVNASLERLNKHKNILRCLVKTLTTIRSIEEITQ